MHEVVEQNTNNKSKMLKIFIIHKMHLKLNSAFIRLRFREHKKKVWAYRSYPDSRPSTALWWIRINSLHLWRYCRDTYIQHQKRTSLPIPITVSCRSSLSWNKAKRFLNMSVAICNMPKIGIIQQKTFNVSCLFCKTIHFFSFYQEKRFVLWRKKMNTSRRIHCWNRERTVIELEE